MPVDRGVIEQQLNALGEGPGWWERRELRDLPAVLDAGERILAIARGRLKRRDPLRRPWLVVVTDRRLVCLQSAPGIGWRQVELAAGQIARTALRVGPFRARLLIAGGGNTYRLSVARPDAYKLLRAISSIGAPAQEAYTGFRFTLMVRRVFDHVLELPAAALNPGPAAPPVAAPSELEERVQSLEREVDDLRQQVQFLEQLVREKYAERETHLFPTT